MRIQVQYTSLNESETSHIPDFRHQLLWLPTVSLFEGKTVIEIFSSDILGVFEISLEGYSAQGIPVTLKKEFIVE